MVPARVLASHLEGLAEVNVPAPRGLEAARADPEFAEEVAELP
jgi:hypothetical protein